MVEFVVRRLGETIEGTCLDDLFTEDSALVPAPGSAPLHKSGGVQLWPTLRLSEELVSAGFGSEVVPLLKRVTAVPKSAYAKPGERPGPEQHAQSMAVTTSLTVTARRLVIVDDVLTRGATMLGCASRLAEAYPETEIIGFALARTRRISFDNPIDPAVNEVRSPGPGQCDCSRLTPNHPATGG